MVRSSALASLLLSADLTSSAMSGPSTKEGEVNGVRLPCVDQI
jgi:hypothetical protein